MNSQCELPILLPSHPDPAEFEEAEVVIEDYLDRLSANLLGRVSTDERCRQKDEARFHIERLAAHHQSQGKSPIEAARLAAQKYGDPAVISDQVVLRSYEEAIPSKLFRTFGRGNVTAFAIVGAFQLLLIVLLQLKVFAPNSSPYSLALDPAEMRAIFPWPLPLPQTPSDIWILYIFPAFAPILIGAAAGAWIPVRPGRAVAGATMASVLYTFAVAVSLLPRTEMLLLALFELVFWIPLGILSAEISLGLKTWRVARSRHGGYGA